MSTDLHGASFGRYTLERCLEDTPTTEVYLAQQPDIKRQVAVKFLKPKLAQAKGVSDQFSRAVRGAVLLQHQNIERVYETNTHDSRPYKAMEYIVGPTLKDLVDELRSQRKLLPLPVVGTIISQVATGLTYANEQEQNPVHHGISTANIFLRVKPGTPDDITQFVLGLGPSDVVLADYGVARVIHDAIQNIAPDTVLDIANYTAPELCQGKKGDGRADIYALGIVLYELLTGTLPFPDRTPSVVMHKHINEPLPAPRTLRPDIPDDVEQIVLKATSKNLNERFFDAEAFGLALKQRMGRIEPSLQLADMPANVAGGGPPAPTPAVAAQATTPQQNTAPSVPTPPPRLAQPPKSRQAAATPKAPATKKKKQAKRSSSGMGTTIATIVVVVMMIVAIAAIWLFFMR